MKDMVMEHLRYFPFWGPIIVFHPNWDRNEREGRISVLNLRKAKDFPRSQVRKDLSLKPSQWKTCQKAVGRENGQIS